MEPPSKRLKLGSDNENDVPNPVNLRAKRAGFLSSLNRKVSPPPGSTKVESVSTGHTAPKNEQEININSKDSNTNYETIDLTREESEDQKPSTTIRSPVQLTRIVDLPKSDNVDTVSLNDILGDPLIKEAWIFNFCFDIDWTMQHFDHDIRQLVKVKIIHGSWRREDTNKINIDEACSRWPNVESIQAYLPDAFGTHHSKMFILFRHDDQAQVIIHTANMLRKDWTNMTQAIWRSPLLPSTVEVTRENDGNRHGKQFQKELLRYLNAYGYKLKSLTQQLKSYDFSEIKAVLIASVPSEFSTSDHDDKVWGHESLRRALNGVPSHSQNPHFAFQVSSIASLPANWLAETLYAAAGPRAFAKSVSIIYPTAEDVRSSLDGYEAGGSIHTKAQSSTHLKQITSIHPQMCRWTKGTNKNAGRDRAAPHIKTYIRFTSQPSKDQPTPNIEWALVTSANLSTQAWGSAPKVKKGTTTKNHNHNEATVKIQSFEVGVLVWPELLVIATGDKSNTKQKVKMIPTFKTDVPQITTASEDKSDDTTSTIIGFRMPYDLPLTPYLAGEMPWSPHSSYELPDGHGNTWP